MRGRLRALVVPVLAAAAVAGYLLAGGLGLLVVCVFGYLTTLVAVRRRLPAPLARRPRPPKPQQGMANAGFPAYRRMQSMLAWSEQSPRHFDGAVRPTLQRLTADRLAERRGIDLVAEPDRAQEVLGVEVWPLVDPSRPRSTDSTSPGVPLDRVGRLVSRLEEL